MKQKTLKRISGTVAFLAALAFIVKFAGPSILKLYIEFGVGNCRTIPILCMLPEDKILASGQISRGYIERMDAYHFPKMSLYAPKGFSVTQETIKKDYYKRRKQPYRDAAVYVLYEERGFFIDLFPQLKKKGINDNYEFIKRVMYARISDISGVADMFFIIMKGIFTPDLGDQKNVKMIQFGMEDRKGFINYNLADKENYFDCNVISDKGGFFKIYIKDEGARLDLNWVLAIISTLDNK